MPVDFTASGPEGVPGDLTPNESSMFAPVPTWERNRKRRGRAAGDRRGGAAPMAIAAGLIVLAGAAAAGWYATQPHDQGVAQLTPGGAAATAEPPAPADTRPALAQNAAPPTATLPVQVAPNERPHATTPAAPTRHATTGRSRSRSVEDVGVNASTTESAPVRAAPVTPAPSAAAPATPAPVNPTPSETAPATQPSTATTDQPPPQ